MIEETLTRLLKDVCPLVFPRLAPPTAGELNDEGKIDPFIVYTRVSTPREVTLSGPANVAYPTFRVDLYAERYGQAVALANDVRITLDGYRDDEVLYCRLVNQLDLTGLDKEDPLSRINLEFRFTHKE